MLVELTHFRGGIRASWASERQRQRKHFRGFCVRESRAFAVWPRVEWTMRENLLRLPGFLAYRATGEHETGRRSKKNNTSRHASGHRAAVPPASPPLPPGSKASTSGFGTNLAPVALGRSCWAPFRSPAFVSVFLETQLRSWPVPSGYFPAVAAALGTVRCTEAARALLCGGSGARAENREADSRSCGPGADLPSFFPSRVQRLRR